VSAAHSGREIPISPNRKEDLDPVATTDTTIAGRTFTTLGPITGLTFQTAP
jgi:hypothetical protein